MSTYLCEDLLVEIFTRLPSKSLIRFRSLSKSWCSRIASPSFRRLHTLRSPQKVLLKHIIYIVRRFYTLHSEDQFPLGPIRNCFPVVGFTLDPIRFDDNVGFDHIVGSRNGILCLFRFQGHILCVGDIILWNPSIRRKLTLPRHPLAWSYSHDSRVLLGFCFDPLADDYKIVTISYKYKGDVIDSYVYTMKTGNWCKIASPAIKFSSGALRGCFVNGTMHWLVEQFKNESDEIGYGFRDGFILTFDSGTNTFGTIALPEPSWLDTKLKVINDSLAVIGGKGGENYIWVRREHNNTSSWFKVFSQMTTNDCLQLHPLYASAVHVYNLQTRVQSGTMKFNAASLKVDMEMYGESLELLNTKNAYTSDGFRIYNKPQTWMDSESSLKVDIEMCAESRELLDRGNVCQGNQPAEGKRRSKTAPLQKMCKLFSSCLHL